MRGLVIGSVCSGSGKTLLASGLMRLLCLSGYKVAAGKVGPDYIDGSFHAVACGQASMSFDLWALGQRRLHAWWHIMAERGYDYVVIEGVMGLFDKGRGASTADVAAFSGLAVVLVIDAACLAESVVALVEGFYQHAHRHGVTIKGVIVNRVGSQRHRMLLRDALSGAGVRVYGMVPRDDCLVLPKRLLGLVPSWDAPQEAEKTIERAAAFLAQHIDIDGLKREAMLTGRPQPPPQADAFATMMDGLLYDGVRRLAVSYDSAFCFVYGWLCDSWRRHGCDVVFFSPLADEAPPDDVDGIFLAGGYPENHAAVLADNEKFLQGLRRCAGKGIFIYGECGGFMVLGEQLRDRQGVAHRMAGLLPLETSIETPRLSLCYREVSCLSETPLGQRGAVWRGHEFHYARIVTHGICDGLFVDEAVGQTLGMMKGSVCGSFVHLLARVKSL